MRKHHEGPRAPNSPSPRPPPRARWRPSRPLPPVELAVAVGRLELQAAFGRTPTVDELGARVGLRERDVRARLDLLDARGVPAELPARALECLAIVAALRAELGRSPSTAEVSDRMGIARSGSRYHLGLLVELGLVTPPRAMIVLDVTAIGRAVLAAAARPAPAPATRPAMTRAPATLPPESSRT